MTKSLVLYLIGKPGVGKYTIACELIKKGNFLLCDNHLINNPVFSLLELEKAGSNIPDFAWDAIEEIRDSIFNLLVKIPNKNCIITNYLGDTQEDKLLYDKVKKMAKKRNSLFVPVHLKVENKLEHLKRLTNESRPARYKSTQSKEIEAEEMIIQDQNLLELDISDLSMSEAAEQIMLQYNTLLTT